MTTSLINLPLDVFFIIFPKCSDKDLCHLRLTCKPLKNIVDEWLLKLSKHLLVTNFKDEKFRFISPTLNVIDKFRISYNWKMGRCKMSYIKITNGKSMPWIQLTDEYIFVSDNKSIKKLSRLPHIIKKPNQEWKHKRGSEINKFVCNDGLIVSADSDGYLSIWDLEENIPFRKQISENPIKCVDLQNNLITVGCNIGTFRLYSYKNEELQPVFESHLNKTIWSSNIYENKVALGCTGDNNGHCLHIFDSDSMSFVHKLGKLRYSSVLDIKWENSNILLTCGHGSDTNKWDLRVPLNPVNTWLDPFGEALYCLDTDKSYTFVTGAQYYGRMILWDCRCDVFQQLYYLSNLNEKSNQTIRSPVYSLSFDASRLYAATDQRLYTLDFASEDGNYNRDFRYARSYSTVNAK